MTLEQAINWCKTTNARIIFAIGYVEVTIRSYPSMRAETVEQAVTGLQEIQQARATAHEQRQTEGKSEVAQ